MLPRVAAATATPFPVYKKSARSAFLCCRRPSRRRPEVWAPQRQCFFSTAFLSLRAPLFFRYKIRTSGAVLGAHFRHARRCVERHRIHALRAGARLRPARLPACPCRRRHGYAVPCLHEVARSAFPCRRRPSRWAKTRAPELWAPQRQSFFSTAFLSLRAPLALPAPCSALTSARTMLPASSRPSVSRTATF